MMTVIVASIEAIEIFGQHHYNDNIVVAISDDAIISRGHEDNRARKRITLVRRNYD